MNLITKLLAVLAITACGGPADAAPGAAPEVAPVTPSAAAAPSVVGTWSYVAQNGTATLVLRADGSGDLNGVAFTYTFGASKLVARANGSQMSYDAVLEGDALTLSGGDLPAAVTFKRQAPGAAAPAPSGPMAQVAGVWVAEESSLDPSFYLSYTQYVTLYANGTVAYQKAEGSASRTQISQSWERFRYSNESGAVRGEAGTWETDGSSIVIRWRLWNGLVSRGQVQGEQLTLSGMGVLESGTTLSFKRER